MRRKLKSIFKHKKDTSTIQIEPQAARSDQGSSNDSNSLIRSRPETLSENLPNLQRSISIVVHERHPALIQHNDRNDMIDAGEIKKSEDLWERAYEDLKCRVPDLVTAFERLLAPDIVNQAKSPLNLEVIETIVKSKLEDREASQLVIKLGQQPVKIREQGKKVIQFILWSNGIVSQALSAQPYLALAWSGVSILLPLLLNSSEQSRKMIEGLNTITDLLRLYRIKEDIYIRGEDKTASPDFVQAVVQLYSNIFEYQAQMICHLSQTTPKRAIRGTFKLDDWEGLQKKVQTSDENCTRYCSESDRKREKEFYDDQSSQILQLVETQTATLNVLKTSQVHGQLNYRDDKESELLKILASDYESDKDSVSRRVPGTCEWFYKDDKFLEWRDSQDCRLLWVSAGPGCGKSVLSRSLIDERIVCTSSMASTVCYFFFKDGDEQRMRGANALGAILHQLFKDSPLISYALPSSRSFGQKLRDSFSELWGILIQCARDPEAGEIICVVDALDECEEDTRNQLLEKLVSFFTQRGAHQGTSLRLKFLITSRPYEDLEEKFQALAGISTYLHFDGDDKSQTIEQEINLVIDHEIPRIARDFSYEDRGRISDRLKEMNNRTYLWLFLTINIIRGSPSNYSRVSSIDTLLDNLPLKISDAYEKILSRSSDKTQARILLQLIVVATRPLSLQEVNYALALANKKTSCTSQQKLELWPQKIVKSNVQNLCGLFVSVRDEKISLIHQTAREFLTKVDESQPIFDRKWQGCLDVVAAHGSISRICIGYLNLDDFASIAQSHSRRRNDIQDNYNYPLLNYAAGNWAAHYTSQLSKLAKDTQEAAQKLCNILLPQHSYWFHMYCETRYLDYRDWTSLGIASSLGLTYVVEGFLDEGADVDAQGGEYGNALQAASSEGHDRVVQILLDKGADVNAQGGEYGNALQAASSEGHDRVVLILLDKGADVNTQGGLFGNALRAASLSGHDRVVQILLDKKARRFPQQGSYAQSDLVIPALRNYGGR